MPLFVSGSLCCSNALFGRSYARRQCIDLEAGSQSGSERRRKLAIKRVHGTAEGSSRCNMEGTVGSTQVEETCRGRGRFLYRGWWARGIILRPPQQNSPSNFVTAQLHTHRARLSRLSRESIRAIIFRHTFRLAASSRREACKIIIVQPLQQPIPLAIPHRNHARE